MKSNSELKAFSVQADEFGCIRFAKNNVTARREGAGELGVEFNEIVSCRRVPELDSYAAIGSVPWKVLLTEHGWSQECGYCYRMVYAEPGEYVFDDENDQAYCSVECQARHENYEREVLGGQHTQGGGEGEQANEKTAC
ncbi:MULTISPECIES: hypothetical protein [unclassified Serratia (in: enterobacteria)]|uniref:hypothetical protein n=1 Tax=unclassified Serratia (in: enterobacteria) TaxID=2647522 RepID=UPI001268290C|nr:MULTISPECIES: hypothetical protein [unclassified Serratia (in: enterobacteria)]